MFLSLLQYIIITNYFLLTIICLEERFLKRCSLDLGRFSEDVANYAIFRAALRACDAVPVGACSTVLVTPALYECVL